MRPLVLFTAAAAILSIASAAPLAEVPPKMAPYLNDAQSPDTTTILPPAPLKGTARYESDRRIFRATRKLKGTARWAMALGDDVINGQAIAGDFVCSLGVAVNAADEPALVHLVSRATLDLVQAIDRAKADNKRKRPFLIDKGETCIPISDAFAATYDYPSGHSAYGWAVALIFAEIAPDRATQVLARGRAFGESRLVCGVHNASAVEAGRTEGSVVIAALHGSPEFRADLEAARAEVARARAEHPAAPSASCAAETALVAERVY